MVCAENEQDGPNPMEGPKFLRKIDKQFCQSPLWTFYGNEAHEVEEDGVKKTIVNFVFSFLFALRVKLLKSHGVINIVINVLYRD